MGLRLDSTKSCAAEINFNSFADLETANDGNNKMADNLRVLSKTSPIHCGLSVSIPHL